MSERMILPTSIAGYQHVVFGPVKAYDIWVLNGKPVSWVGQEYVGRLIEHLPCGGIYRKMKCPDSASSDDTTGWKKRQEELRELGGLRAAVVASEQSKEDANLSGACQPQVSEKAATYDEGKPPLAYLPWAGIDEVAMVQAYGHKKYKDYNNYRKGMEVGRNLSCAIRHIRAYMEGEDMDPESGRNHLAHAACRLLFVLQNIKDGKAIDDRYHA